MSGFAEDDRIRNKNKEYNRTGDFVEDPKLPSRLHLLGNVNLAEFIQTLVDAGYSYDLSKETMSLTIYKK